MQGFFDDKNKEYVIKDMKPRRPWLNYLWNDRTVCQCDQFGNGFSWMAIDTQRRDIERGVRNVYIKDKDTGEVYSANRNYDDLPFETHETHVGINYQKIICEYKGIAVIFTICVPKDDAVVLYEVKAENRQKQKRNIDLYFCLQPSPALSWHDAYGYADNDEKSNGLLYSHEGFALPNDYTKVFVGCNRKYDAYDLSHAHFKGEYNGYDRPIGLKADKLSCTGATFEQEYVAAFQFSDVFKGSDSFEATFCSFAARNETEIGKYRKKYLEETSFRGELQKVSDGTANEYDVFELNSPDVYLNSQVNIWLKRQMSLGKTWGRLYGKGFRDVMQDITAFVSLDTAAAEKQILHALKYQYEDGNPIRMFEPSFKFPYNDGGVWIPGTILSYLNESGDLSILQKEVPYLKGDSYENASYADSFVTEPYVAGERSGSVLDHVLSAIDYLAASRGKHNLILWRGGDWNDSMNNVGRKNKGESVWLSVAAVKAINELNEILRISGNDRLIEEYEKKKRGLIAAIKEYGIVDGHFIYGYNDEGEIIGGKERIFLNPQTWSVLAEIGSAEDREKIMDVVENSLKCDYGYVQCRPSFTRGDDGIGRVSYFQPGLVENGAVYNHGVAFKIAADCMLGRAERAYKTLKMISCDNPSNPDNGAEPYAVSNMYMGPENKYIAGYAPMSWITGTAGWLYRCVTEFMCGIKPTAYGLEISPCLPENWNGITVKRRFRGETYDIRYEKADRKEVICDGKNVKTLTLTGKGSVHKVLCRY